MKLSTVKCFQIPPLHIKIGQHGIGTYVKPMHVNILLMGYPTVYILTKRSRLKYLNLIVLVGSQIYTPMALDVFFSISIRSSRSFIFVKVCLIGSNIGHSLSLIIVNLSYPLAMVVSSKLNGQTSYILLHFQIYNSMLMFYTNLKKVYQLSSFVLFSHLR
mgnify:FL=1